MNHRLHKRLAAAVVSLSVAWTVTSITALDGFGDAARAEENSGDSGPWYPAETPDDRVSTEPSAQDDAATVNAERVVDKGDSNQDVALGDEILRMRTEWLSLRDTSQAADEQSSGDIRGSVPAVEVPHAPLLFPDTAAMSELGDDLGMEILAARAEWLGELQSAASGELMSFDDRMDAPLVDLPVPMELDYGAADLSLAPGPSGDSEGDLRLARSRFLDLMEQPPTLPNPATGSAAGAGEGGDESTTPEDEQTYGEAPEETNNELIFLRRQSTLLEPGQYQFDISFTYLLDETDFTLAQLNGNTLQIAEARRRQRVMMVPFEFRMGVSPVAQVFVNVPFGWSNGEFVFLNQDEFANRGGIGDVSAGFTRHLMQGTDCFPDVYATFAFSAPTADVDFATSLAIPGSALGQGFWTVLAGLNFIQTYDPFVVFYGAGYRHRFENTFDGGIRVDPGKQIFYRFGAGLAVNPRITLSAAFTGSYITEDYVNDVRLVGSIREPMAIRLAATIGRCAQNCRNNSQKTVEPFVNFGITDDAIDTAIGVSWTH